MAISLVVIEEARACAAKVVASGHMCYGCHMDFYCEVSKLFNERREEEYKEWERSLGRDE